MKNGFISFVNLAEQAEAMGKKAQNFMKSLSMDRVYDYMFHLISEYAKLLDFKPVRPSSALEVCVDSLLCFADEKQREFLEMSTLLPSPSPPCQIQPPDSAVIEKWIEEKKKIIDKVQGVA